MAWLQNRFLLKQKNHHSAARYQAWQHDEGEEEAIKRMAEKKKDTLADSNYFYTKESIPCTNLRAQMTPFVCTLHTWS